MGRMSQRKGYRIENEIRLLHVDLGIPAQRMPLSGALGGDMSGDLRIGTLRAEVKARANGAGFRTLEKWLAGNDLLFLRRNRQPPLVVMP